LAAPTTTAPVATQEREPETQRTPEPSSEPEADKGARNRYRLAADARKAEQEALKGFGAKLMSWVKSTKWS